MKIKQKTKPAARERRSLATGKTPEWIYLLILGIFTLGLYWSTVRNHYSIDDYHIAANSGDAGQGIRAIPKIFSSLYATEGELSYGYRALTRTSFAVEYQFFGANPYLSHFMNNIFFVIAVLMLYRVLRRLLKDHHPFFPFAIAMLFAAHPIHTEVVASLKNRDELFVMILGLWSLDRFISYAGNGRNRHLITGMVIYALGYLAKPTMSTFFWLIPLSLYFFTSMEKKVMIRFIVIFTAVTLVAAFGPFLYLPPVKRPLSIIENPLAIDPSLGNYLAYAGFTLFYYLRLLVFPHPLLYYYGYNMFPDISLANWMVILGLLVHLALLAYALWKFREKQLWSFIILAYLTTIAAFSNLLKPAPGIIAERFAFVPSIAFCLALAYFLFRILRLDVNSTRQAGGRFAALVAILVLILIPYSAKTFTRIKDWRTEYSLLKADMPFLYDSFKANDQFANVIMKSVNRELAKPVNVLKFVDPQIKEAIQHWERASEIVPYHPGPPNNIGMIYSRTYKNQDTAIQLFEKALKCYPTDKSLVVDNKLQPLILFNMGMAYENMKDYITAIDYYRKSLAIDSSAINTRSRLANAYYMIGEFKKAVDLNQQITQLAPKESLPYVNLGNYYIFQKDTANAIRFYEKAVELGAPYEASQFLSLYFNRTGNTQKAAYYRKIAEDLKKQPRP